MRSPTLACCCAVSLAAFLGACSSDATGPHLASITPNTAARNDSVTISGTGLCGPSGDCANAGGMVQIGLMGAVEAAIESSAPTSIQIIIPAITPIGATQVLLTVDGESSNELDFTVTQ